MQDTANDLLEKAGQQSVKNERGNWKCYKYLLKFKRCY